MTFAALSQYTLAETLTVDLLQSTSDWTHKNGSAPGSVSISGGGSNYMTYEFDRMLSATDEQNLTFTLTLNIGASSWSGEYDALTGVAFIGSAEAIVIGSLDYIASTSFGYATSTNTSVNFYNLTGGAYSGLSAADVSSTYTSLSDTHPLGQDLTVTGTIAKKTEGTGYAMTLIYGDATYTVDMGDTVNMDRVVFYADGPVPATIKALTMTGYVSGVSEITWAGTSENNTWGATSFAGGAATDDGSKVTFDVLSEGISDTVVISGSVLANSVVINDDYTFQADGVAKLTPGTLTIAEGKTLTYSGTGTLTIDSAIGANLNVTGGTLNLKGEHAINGDELNITNGIVYIEHDAGSNNSSAIHKDTQVSIGAGGTLHIKGHDSMGWGSQWGKTLASIQLKGTDAGNKASLILEDTGNYDGKNSIGYELNMQGYSSVSGQNGNNIIQGAGVNASGTGNSITFGLLQLSIDWNVTVDTDSELSISFTSTGKTGRIVKKGAGALTLSGPYANALTVEAGSTTVEGALTGNVSVTGGTLNVSGAGSIGGGQLSITNGTVNAHIDNGNAGSVIHKNTAVSIYGGGTLNLSGHDMLNWQESAPASILLRGESAEKLATLHIDDYEMKDGVKTAASATMTTTLNMEGYSQVTGNKYNTFSYEVEENRTKGVVASGVNNTISVSEIQIRKDWILDVADSGELSVSSKLTAHGDNANAKLIKENAGKLTLSGANTYTGGTEIKAGTLVTNNAAALGTGKVTMNGGNLQLASSLAVSSLELTEGSIIFGNGTILSVTNALTLDASSIKLAEGISFESAEDQVLISAAGGLTATSVDSWIGGRYTIGGKEYTAGLTASGDSLSLCFSEIVTPGGDSLLTTTVTGFESYTDGMLTLKVDGTLAEGMAVVIEGFGSGVLDSILQNVKTGTMVGITLTDGTTSIVGTAEQNVGFQGAEGIYYGENVDGAWQYNVSYIPEPTTATLSLLALCGLAARRRRASR